MTVGCLERKNVTIHILLVTYKTDIRYVINCFGQSQFLELLPLFVLYGIYAELTPSPKTVL